MTKKMFPLVIAFLCVLFVSCQTNKNTTTTYTVDTSTTYELQYGLQAYTGVMDTFITAQASSQPFQSSSSLTISNETYTAKALIAFDLGMIPQDKVVTSCQLCMALYPAASSAGTTPVLNIFKINTPWSDSVITYNNAAALTTTAVYHNSVTITPDSTLRCYDLQTLMPQEWVTNPGGNYGIIINAVDGTAPATLYLESSEYTTPSFRPKLIITVK